MYQIFNQIFVYIMMLKRLLSAPGDGKIQSTREEKTGNSEDGKMKTKFYLDGKKTTRKAVKELVGEERLKRMLKEAKETFFEDPMVQNDFFLGKQMLTIEFC